MSETPTIREATVNDLDAVEQLLRAQPPGFAHHHEELVIDAPDGGLAAAALVHIDGRRGHLLMLAVAKRFEGDLLEERLIGVAEALCKAFGAHTLDVPARDAA